MAKQRVCAKALVRDGEVRVVTCGDRRIALSKIDGELYAIDDVCSHDAGPLGEGSLIAGRVVCPRHGAAFDPKTGKALTLPAVAPVKSYPVQVDGDDIKVEVDG